MGQKVHPLGFRLGITKDWLSRWYAKGQYGALVQEDLRLRRLISQRLADAGVPRVEIERSANQLTITVHTAKPGIVIGKGGQRVDELRSQLEGATGKKVRLNIQEIRQPELEAALVARGIAEQLERRVSHKRAIKQAMTRTMQRGAKGIKILCAGRLGGSEMARRDLERVGRVPLHTLRADIDYGFAEALTTFGRIGIKVWIFKGEMLPEPKRGRPGEVEEVAV